MFYLPRLQLKINVFESGHVIKRLLGLKNFEEINGIIIIIIPVITFYSSNGLRLIKIPGIVRPVFEKI